MRRLVLVLPLLVALGCSRSSPEVVPASSSSAAGSAAAPVASASPSASVAPSTVAGGPKGWKGTYKTTPGALAVPADWSKTHWSSSDTTTGIGDGAMALLVDPGTHRVTGTLEGPAGPALLEGHVEDGKLSAAVRRKDPTDRGFTGTLLGTLGADKAEGTLSLASGDGAMVRSGTFSLSPSGS